MAASPPLARAQHLTLVDSRFARARGNHGEQERRASFGADAFAFLRADARATPDLDPPPMARARRDIRACGLRLEIWFAMR
jgi:hypothetical protein